MTKLLNDKKDEMEALLSIYSTSIDINDVRLIQYDMESGCFIIHTNLPKIMFIINAEKNSLLAEEVACLPPIHLEFYLPDDYPHQTAPVIHMQCFWLSASQIQELYTKLYDMWKTKFGCVILYNWIQFLSQDLISFLNVTNLKLNANNFQYCLQYIKQMNLQDFNKSLHCCEVCFEEKIGSEYCRFEPCGHWFCHQCLKKDFELKVIEGSICDLSCLNTDCNSLVNIQMVKEIISNECFVAYENIILQRGIEEMKDIKYCPFKKCNYPVVVDLDACIGICPVCSFSFCTICMRATHGIEKCRLKIDDQRKLLKQYHESDAVSKSQLLKKHGKKMLEEMEKLVLSTDWIIEHCKPCPVCHTDIEKMEGCNKMSCHKCRAFFCWICMQPLSRSNPYAHFSDKSLTCYNRLFFGVSKTDLDLFVEEEVEDEAVEEAVK